MLQPASQRTLLLQHAKRVCSACLCITSPVHQYGSCNKCCSCVVHPCEVLHLGTWCTFTGQCCPFWVVCACHAVTDPAKQCVQTLEPQTHMCCKVSFLMNDLSSINVGQPQSMCTSVLDICCNAAYGRASHSRSSMPHGTPNIRQTHHSIVLI